MLGFAVAGVVLTRALPAVLARRDEYLAAFGALFALTLLATSAIFSHLPAGVQFTNDPAVFVKTLLTWLPAALLFAVPFGFAGLILGALLSDPRLPARLVYGADLLGSALGALIVIPAIRHLGVERSLALCAAVTLAGLLARGLAAPGGDPRPLRGGRRGHRARRGAARTSCSRSRCARARRWSARESDRYGIEYVQWDPVARIEISRIPPPHPEPDRLPAADRRPGAVPRPVQARADPERLRLLLHGGVRRPAGVADGHRATPSTPRPTTRPPCPGRGW